MFENKVVVITGGANGIGKCIAEEFQKNGAQAAIIDKAPGGHFVGDIADKCVLEDFVEHVVREHGRIDYLINNALPIMRGIDACSYEEFQYAMSVGVACGTLSGNSSVSRKHSIPFSVCSGLLLRSHHSLQSGYFSRVSEDAVALVS